MVHSIRHNRRKKGTKICFQIKMYVQQSTCIWTVSLSVIITLHMHYENNHVSGMLAIKTSSCVLLKDFSNTQWLTQFYYRTSVKRIFCYCLVLNFRKITRIHLLPVNAIADKVDSHVVIHTLNSRSWSHGGSLHPFWD